MLFCLCPDVCSKWQEKRLTLYSDSWAGNLSESSFMFIRTILRHIARGLHPVRRSHQPSKSNHGNRRVVRIGSGH